MNAKSRSALLPAALFLKPHVLSGAAWAVNPAGDVLLLFQLLGLVSGCVGAACPWHSTESNGITVS